jgi:hypothetical protein
MMFLPYERVRIIAAAEYGKYWGAVSNKKHFNGGPNKQQGGLGAAFFDFDSRNGKGLPAAV